MGISAPKGTVSNIIQPNLLSVTLVIRASEWAPKTARAKYTRICKQKPIDTASMQNNQLVHTPILVHTHMYKAEY